MIVLTVVGLGTLTNVVAIVLGSTLGLVLRGQLSARTANTVTDVLGLVVLVVGALSVRPLLGPALAEAVGGAGLVVVLLALLAGTALGSWLRVEDRMDDLGQWTRRRLGAGDESRFAEGFVTATLVFCVGPLAILGSIADGLGQGPQQLVVKAVLDGFAAMAFASTLGIGVMASAVAVGIYQGLFTILGATAGAAMPAAQIDAMGVTGGIILLGLALRLLELKPIRVADMLPGLAFAPLFVWIAERIA